MTPRFSVRAIPQFRRAAERLTAQHPTFSPPLARAIEILEADPANVRIAGSAVELLDCGIRREDTYRER